MGVRKFEMKKIISLLLILSLTLSMTMGEVAFGDKTTADTPSDAAGLMWKKKLGEGYANAPTPPLVKDGYLYVGAGYYIYKLNKNTGAVVQKSQKLAGSMGYATNPPVYGNNKIYITVGSGKVQALDINTLKIKWTSGNASISGQTMSPIVFSNGNIYTGTFSGKGGQYFCVNADTGAIKWSIPNDDGYYWSGAYATGDYVVFGSESIDSDPQKNSIISSVDSGTGILISSMSAVGGVRSTIINDDDGNLYAATQGGKLYKIIIDADGNFVSNSSCNLSGATTGKPTIFHNRIYIGTSASKVDVINTGDLSNSKTISMPGYPQNGVLIAERNSGEKYLYATYNSYPGGIVMADLNKENVVGNKNFFIPADSQFCLSPIVADDNTGVLYYKNDSCYLMAVDTAANSYTPTPGVRPNTYNSLKIQWPKAANAVAYTLYRATSKSGTYSRIATLGASSLSYTNSGLKTGTTYYYKVQARYTGISGSVSNGKMSAIGFSKPILSTAKIKTSSKKKAVKISWNKVSGASGYQIYRAASKKGKYKKVKTVKKGTTKSWINKKLKSKKKYYYKIKAYRIVSGKKVYSVYSNISYKRTK